MTNDTLPRAVIDEDIQIRIITPGGMLVDVTPQSVTHSQFMDHLEAGRDDMASQIVARVTGCPCTIDRRVQTTSQPPK